MFLYVIETLAVVACKWSGWIFPISVGLIQIFMNLTFLWGCQSMSINNCATFCAAPVFVYPSAIHDTVKFRGNIHCVTHFLLPFWVYVYTGAVVMIQCGTNISSWISTGWPIHAVYVIYIFNHTDSRVANWIIFIFKLLFYE